MIPALQGIIAPKLASIVLNTVFKKVKDNVPEDVAENLEGVFSSLEKKGELEKEIMQIVLQHNEQLVKELEIKEKHKAIGLGSYVRPVLTFAVTTVFNVALLAGLALNKVSFQEYIATLAPLNSMLLGFWFGERSALKDPRKGVIDDG